jgi:CheY-like chemotaxis protein
MSVRAKEKGIELSYEMEPGTPNRVKGDPDRLRQILINLVSNAIKFTAEGRVVIRVGPESAEGMLRFSVSDTGIGIAPDKVEMIFDSFTQADASMTRRYGGTGLGLAICKRLVSLLGGEIWVESTLGAGATFVFTMKYAIGEEPVAEAPQRAGVVEKRSAASASSLRILVVDDSEENRFLVAEYLKDSRCEVEFAVNGREAVDKFVGGVFDLVLMDLQMPLLDGYEATRRIRGWEEEQKRAMTPIIALTASAMDSELQKSLDAGCTSYLRKPVRLVTLLEAVQKYAAPAKRIMVRPDVRLKHLIPSYLESRKRDVEKIATALEQSDFDIVREIGHKMSGTGGGFGFPRITSIGQAIEMAAKEKSEALIRARSAELSRFLDQVELSE